MLKAVQFQVLCEELEYSELLDRATQENDPFHRMVYRNVLCTCSVRYSIRFMFVQVLITAFAISRYASTRYRGHGKPFNPLEGETYECIRQDLGWRFVSEQVP